jgi:uncharacterized protein DUF4262
MVGGMPEPAAIYARRVERRLPEPTDDSERQAIRDIEEHGWHVILVRKRVHDHERFAPRFEDATVRAAYEACFTYTVGLWHTFGHPEIVLVGEWQHAHPYLNAVGELVREGHEFRDGSTTGELLDGFTVRFDEISDTCRVQLLTWSDWANSRSAFDALQLVLPDTNGRWPEDPDYNGFAQPVLRD